MHRTDVPAPPPQKPTSEGSEDVMTPQESSVSVVTEHPASKTSLGWINGKLWLLLWTSTEDQWRHQVTCSSCRHLKEHIHLAEGMMSLPVEAIGWWTHDWCDYSWNWVSLQDQKKGDVIVKYPSMSGGWMSWHLPPWHRVLPSKQRGTLAASRRVALYPHYTEQDDHQNKRKTGTRW